MAFWSTERFAEEQEDFTLIDPYASTNLRHGAYELAVGPEAFITSTAVKTSLGDRGQINIPSGQFGLLITEESVSVPPNAIAFISIRAGIKFQGLVNVSGFHVDPGFTGRLKFAVYNAGSHDMVFDRGERIFLIWYSDLDRITSDSYRGSRRGQEGVSADDVRKLRGDIASPAALQAEIKAVKLELGLWKAVFLALLLAFLTSLLKDTANSQRSSTPQTGSPASVPAPLSPQTPSHPASTVHTGGRTPNTPPARAQKHP